MSAWIVAAAQIDVLVLAGVQFGVSYDAGPSTVPAPLGLAAAGRDLWAENHRSIDHRYGGRTEPSSYLPPAAEVLLDRVAVVKAIDCYVYQSSEHPGWSTSRAADYCRRLRAAAMAGLPLAPDGGRYPIGWDEAPWGIVQLAQAAVAAGGVDRATTPCAVRSSPRRSAGAG